MDQEHSTIRYFEGAIPVPPGQPFTCQFIQAPFVVPEGIVEIRLRLRYTPERVQGVANLITLGLYDPDGFRGNAHRHPPDETVTLSARQASPGFLAGALPAGRWMAQLAAHAVLPDAQPCRYSLEIELVAGEVQSSAAAPAPAEQFAARGGAHWYRGELHSHTLHSDGRLTPAELVELARARGLDFLFITDHNTHSAFQALETVDTRGLLVIPGVELTTFYGHALVLGTEGWVDWRSGYAGWTMQDAARRAHELGALFILAHPNDIGSPFCTGCRWEYGDFDLALADGVEIWNELWQSGGNKNPGGLQLWQQAQAGPRRWLATAGTDLHSPLDWGGGAPSAYVYARELSRVGILNGLREGRLILSSGPWLHLLTRDARGQVYSIGDTCPAADDALELEIEWADVPPDATLLVRAAADVLNALPVSGSGSTRQAVAGGGRFWLELYDAQGALLALTNPLYAGVPG